MGRGSTSQGTSTGGQASQGQTGGMTGQQSMGGGQMRSQAQDMRGQMQGRMDGMRSQLPQMGQHPFQQGPQAAFPGMDGGMSSQPWGDIDWMKLREQFAQGQGQGSGWMEALKVNASQGGAHANGMTQAMSQARAFSPSGNAGNNQVGFRPQGGNPVTTAGSVAGTQQAPTSSVETGVTPQSSTAGAQPAPQGPPPAAPTGVAPTPANPGAGGNAQALIQALRARRG